MERLWAPWRMAYILETRQPGCFLCDIVQTSRDEDNLVLERGEHTMLLMNRYPYNNGHLMVAPYQHMDALEGLRPEALSELMALCVRGCSRLRQALRPHGFNVGLNLGAAAGAGLKEHLHLHIVPRWEGDTNFMPVLAEVKVIPQSLGELWRQLKEVPA
jgi:ATP adenylyltransferase